MGNTPSISSKNEQKHSPSEMSVDMALASIDQKIDQIASGFAEQLGEIVLGKTGYTDLSKMKGKSSNKKDSVFWKVETAVSGIRETLDKEVVEKFFKNIVKSNKEGLLISAESVKLFTKEFKTMFQDLQRETESQSKSGASAENVVKIIVEGLSEDNIEKLSELVGTKFSEDGLNENTVKSFVESLDTLRGELMRMEKPIDSGPFIESIDELIMGLDKELEVVDGFINGGSIDSFNKLSEALSSIDGVDQSTLDALTSFKSAGEILNDSFTKLGEVGQTDLHMDDLNAQLSTLFTCLDGFKNFDFKKAKKALADMNMLIGGGKITGKFSNATILALFKNIKKLGDNISDGEAEAVLNIAGAIRDVIGLAQYTAQAAEWTDKAVDAIEDIIKDLIPAYAELIDEVINSDFVGKISSLGKYEYNKETNTHYEVLTAVTGVIMDITALSSILGKSLFFAMLAIPAGSLLLALLPTIKNILDVVGEWELNNDKFKELADTLSNAYLAVSYIAKIEGAVILAGVLAPIALVSLTLVKMFNDEFGKFSASIASGSFTSDVEEAKEQVAPADGNGNGGDMVLLLLCSAGLIMLAALVGKYITAHIKDILVFTGTLALFMLAVVGAYSLVAPKQAQAGETAEGIAVLIVASSAIMMLGAMAIMGMPQLPIFALMFAGTLAVFIFAVVGTYALVAGNLQATLESAASVAILIAASAAIMTLGASVFMLAPELMVWAFVFTGMLSAFIFAVLMSYTVAMFFGGRALKSASDFRELVVFAAATMLIGALIFMLAPPLMIWTFVFTTMLARFIDEVIGAYAEHTLFLTLAAKRATKLSWLVTIAAATMLIGAVLLMKYPQLIVYTLVFTLLFNKFLSSMASAFKKVAGSWWSNKLKRGINNLQQMSIAIAMFGGALWITRKAVGDDYLKTIASLGIMLVSVGLFAWIFKILGGGSCGSKMFIGIFGMFGSMFKGGGILSSLKGGIKGIGGSMLKTMELPMRIAIGAMVAQQMGVALLLLGFAFGVVNLVIRDPLLLLFQIGALVFAVLGLTQVFKHLGKKKFVKDIATGAGVAASMGGAIMLLGIAFGLVHMIYTLGNPTIDLLLLSATLVVAGIVFAVLGGLSEFILPGAGAAAAMGGAIALLGIAFIILDKAVNETNPLTNFGKLLPALAVASLTFAALVCISPQIMLGSLAAAMMSGALIALSVAFTMVHTMVNGGANPNEDFKKLNNAITEAGITISSLAELGLWNMLKATVVAGMLSVALAMVTGAFFMVHKLVEGDGSELITKLDAIHQVLLGTLPDGSESGHSSVKTIFKGILDDWDLYVKVALVNLALMAAVGELTASIIMINKAADVTDKLNMVAFDKLTGKDNPEDNIFNKFFSIVTNAGGGKGSLDFALWILEVGAKTLALGAVVTPLCALIGRMASAVADMAELKIPIEWNALGFATNYRTLKNEDFTTAANGVGNIVSTLGGAIIKAYDEAKDKSIFDTGSWFSGKSKFAKVVDAMKTLVPLISEMGKAVGDMAQLMIPVEWNNEGKPIDYRQLSQKDFIEAATGVYLIVTTLGNGLMIAFKRHPLWFIGGEKSIMSTVSKAVSSLGKVVGDIAEGVAKYAAGTIPIYGEDGKIIGNEQMTPQTYQDASDAVMNVVSTLGEGIMKVYDKHKTWFADGIDTKLLNLLGGAPTEGAGAGNNPFVRVVSSVAVLGTLIKNIAEGVLTFASGKIPTKWDKDGKPIDYESLTDKHFVDASVCVATVIGFLGTAVMTFYDNNKDMFVNSNGGKTKFQTVIDGLTPLGNLIKNITDGVIAYAAGKVPMEWNKDGKPTKFKHLGTKEFVEASINIGLVLSLMGDAIVAWSELPKVKEWLTGNTLKPALDVAGKIGGIMKSTADGIQAYYEMGIPIYDKDGKVIGKEKLPDDWQTVVPQNITAVLSTMGEALDNMLKGHPEWADKSHWTGAQNTTKAVNSIITSVAGTVQKVAELKMPDPSAGFDENGNPKKWVALNSESDFNTVKFRIKGMIDAVFSEFTNSDATIYQVVKAMDAYGESGNPLIKLTKIANNIKSALSASMSVIQTIQDTKLNFTVTGGSTDNNGNSTSEAYSPELNDLMEKAKMVFKFIPDTISALFNDNESIFYNFDVDIAIEKINGLMPLIKAYKTFINDSVRDINNMSKSLSTISMVYDEDLQSFNKAMITVIQDVYTFASTANLLVGGLNINTLTEQLTDVSMIVSEYCGFTKNAVNNIIDINTYYGMLTYINLTGSESFSTKLEKIKQLSLSVISSFSQINIRYNSFMLDSITSFIDKYTDFVESSETSFSKISLSMARINDMPMVDKTFNARIENIKESMDKMRSILYPEGTTMENIGNMLFGAADKMLGLDGSLDPVTIMLDQFVKNVEQVAQAGKLANDSSADGLDKLSASLDTIHKIYDRTKPMTSKKFNDEVKIIDRLVTRINTLQAPKVTAMVKLAASLNALSTKFGNLDQLTNALATRLTETLVALTQRIDVARQTIEMTERIQKSRHAQIKQNITMMQKLMGTQLNVAITSDGMPAAGQAGMGLDAMGAMGGVTGDPAAAASGAGTTPIGTKDKNTAWANTKFYNGNKTGKYKATDGKKYDAFYNSDTGRVTIDTNNNGIPDSGDVYVKTRDELNHITWNK